LTIERRMNSRLAKLFWKGIPKNRCMIVIDLSVILSRMELEGRLRVIVVEERVQVFGYGEHCVHIGLSKLECFVVDLKNFSSISPVLKS